MDNNELDLHDVTTEFFYMDIKLDIFMIIRLTQLLQGKCKQSSQKTWNIADIIDVMKGKKTG